MGEWTWIRSLNEYLPPEAVCTSSSAREGKREKCACVSACVCEPPRVGKRVDVASAPFSLVVVGKIPIYLWRK